MSWSDDFDESLDAPKSQRTIRGAQYVHMSTAHQGYSTEKQSDAIARYAAQRNIEIVPDYDISRWSRFQNADESACYE